MLTINQAAADRMERFYDRYTEGDREKSFLSDIASYVKEGDFPFRELEFRFRLDGDEDTVVRIDADSEKLNGIQNKAKNQKAWRYYLVIAQMYRSVKEGTGQFRGQDAGDAWYYTDGQYGIGTYMVPYAVLTLIMDELKADWQAREITRIDRTQKAKSSAKSASKEDENPEEEEETDEGYPVDEDEEEGDDPGEDGEDEEDEEDEEEEE